VIVAPPLYLTRSLTLGAPAADGYANLPQSIAGNIVWTERNYNDQLDAWDYRDDQLGRLVTVQRVATCSSGVVSVAYFPVDIPDAANALATQLTPALFQMGLLFGIWSIADDGTIAAVEADAGAAASAVVAAWPTLWRQRLATDARGSALGVVPVVAASPPSGPRFVALAMAE